MKTMQAFFAINILLIILSLTARPGDEQHPSKGLKVNQNFARRSSVTSLQRVPTICTEKAARRRERINNIKRIVTCGCYHAEQETPF